MAFRLGRLVTGHHRAGSWYSSATASKRWCMKEMGQALSLRPEPLTMITDKSIVRHWSTESNVELPPNLKIDPRSSFAPLQPGNPSFQEEGEEVDENRDSTNLVSDYMEEAEGDGSLIIPLPKRLHVPIYGFSHQTAGQKLGTIWLDEEVFGKDPIRIDLMKQAVDYYRARKRGKRKAATKTISQKRGSGRKVRPQKGQGTARAGHRFAAHWRGGAKAHGPRNNTDYGNVKMNKKTKRLAVLSALSQKLKERNLVVVDTFQHLRSHKTKELVNLLESFGVGTRHGTTALVLDHYYPNAALNEGRVENEPSENEEESGESSTSAATSYRGVPINLWVASGNLYKVAVGNSLNGCNVYDLLKHDLLILSLDALLELERRLTKGNSRSDKPILIGQEEK